MKAGSLAVALSAAVGACGPDGTERDTTDESAGPPVTVTLGSYGATTTDPVIAGQNLNASISAARSRVAALGDPSSSARLVDQLSLRAQVYGTVWDLEEANDAAVAASDTADMRSLLTLAATQSSLHLFDDAFATLDAAAAAARTDSDRGEVERARHAVEVARGEDLADAIEARMAAVAEHPSFSTHTDAAAALAIAGRYAEADEHYVDALQAYRDVSPFPVAWVQFQRGVLWGEAVGDGERAEVLYRDAVRLVPGYVSAQVHLAEIEAGNGAVESAIARLRGVTTAEDPEPWSRLAEYLADSDPEGAAEASREAATRYDALLEDHALAFADHAAEYYLGAGANPERAYELAELNLENRANDRAYQLAVTAAAESGRAERACALLAEAGPDRPRAGLVELRETVSCN